jgi:hypothetical protein
VAITFTDNKKINEHRQMVDALNITFKLIFKNC